MAADPVPRKTAAQLPANERRVRKTDPDSVIIVKDLYGLFLTHKVRIAVDDGGARGWSPPSSLLLVTTPNATRYPPY